jgi:hypothetical protein
VRTAAKRRNARGGTAVRLTGAATSFVCFIPLFDGSALPGFTQDSTMPLRTTILAPAPSAAGTYEDPGVARRLPQRARAVTPLPTLRDASVSMIAEAVLAQSSVMHGPT